MNFLPRAWVRQPSGCRLDLLNPDPMDWADQDLAIGLSRTFRWGGHSVWPLPLSVAQHSLTVLAIANQMTEELMSPVEQLRELLHDADEALIGGFDAISPLKPFLGDAYVKITERLQQAVFTRYGIEYWAPAEFKIHKHADILAASSEAIHVAGWTSQEVKQTLEISLVPLIEDPLSEIYGDNPWEPWAPDKAAERFLDTLKQLSTSI